MNIMTSAAWDEVQDMMNQFFALRSNEVLALIVFTIFFISAKTVQGSLQQLGAMRSQCNGNGHAQSPNDV